MSPMDLHESLEDLELLGNASQSFASASQVVIGTKHSLTYNESADFKSKNTGPIQTKPFGIDSADRNEPKL